MTRPLMLLALAACLAACGPYTEERFLEEATDAQCSWLVGCHPHLYPSLEACLDEVGESLIADDPECAFDPEAARACAQGLEEMACPDGEDYPVYPHSCGEVRACGDGAAE